jgi:hypothetical protein
MGRKIDCAQIVLTCGAAPNWRSAARQPGQPLPVILDFGQAGVGAFPEVEAFLALPRVTAPIYQDSGPE